MIFQVITSVDLADFQKRVNEALDKGWKLHGDMHVTYISSNYSAGVHFAQAMTALPTCLD